MAARKPAAKKAAAKKPAGRKAPNCTRCGSDRTYEVDASPPAYACFNCGLVEQFE